MWRKVTSVPQMPQARTRRSTSLGPGTGRSMFTTSMEPEGPVCTDFIVEFVEVVELMEGLLSRVPE
jgi:hypothetical protein